MKIYVLISLLTAVVASLATEKAMNGTREKKIELSQMQHLLRYVSLSDTHLA